MAWSHWWWICSLPLSFLPPRKPSWSPGSCPCWCPLWWMTTPSLWIRSCPRRRRDQSPTPAPFPRLSPSRCLAPPTAGLAPKQQGASQTCRGKLPLLRARLPGIRFTANASSLNFPFSKSGFTCASSNKIYLHKVIFLKMTILSINWRVFGVSVQLPRQWMLSFGWYLGAAGWVPTLKGTIGNHKVGIFDTHTLSLLVTCHSRDSER